MYRIFEIPDKGGGISGLCGILTKYNRDAWPMLQRVVYRRRLFSARLAKKNYFVVKV